MAEATITLPNVRQESAVQMHAKLKDNGVALDWTGLSDVKAYMYSDAQRVIAGKCTVEINGEDSEVLDVLYPATAPQYLGRYSLLLRCTYQGREKTFDVSVLTFVERTAQATGVTVITDPEMDVQLVVEDVSTSLLDGAIAAALDAASQASEAKDAALAAAALAAEKAGAASDAADLANGKAALVQERLETADADHTRAGEDHDRAVQDHGTAGDDHTLAAGDHSTAESDHTRAGEDHTAAVAATGAANDAATLANAKAALVQDKLDRADTDHTRAESDHSTAVSDSGQAGIDHTQAGTDHGVAADDHTQAVADHAVMAGYDTRLGAVETEVSQLDQKVNDIDVALDGKAALNITNFSGYTQYPGTIVTGVFHSASVYGDRNKYILIPVSEYRGYTAYFIPGGDGGTPICFLASDALIDGENAPFAMGSTFQTYASKRTFKIPDDAAYMFVLVISSLNDRTPGAIGVYAKDAEFYDKEGVDGLVYVSTDGPAASSSTSGIVKKGQIIGTVVETTTGAGNVLTFVIPARKRAKITVSSGGNYGFALCTAQGVVIEYTSNDVVSNGTYIFKAQPSDTVLYASSNKLTALNLLVPANDYCKEQDVRLDSLDAAQKFEEETEVEAVRLEEGRVLPDQTVGADVSINTSAGFGNVLTAQIPANERVKVYFSSKSGTYGFALCDTDGKVLEFTANNVGEDDYYVFAAQPSASVLYASSAKFASAAIVTDVTVKNAVNFLWKERDYWNGKTIWWCGTSIPAGGYPQIVGAMLGATVINQAVGGSMCRANVRTGDYVGANFNNITSPLSATKEEIEAFITNYDSIKSGLIGTVPESLSDEQLTRLRAASFEDKLLPYLDGTEDMPDLFVIDHGHNDFKYLLSNNTSDIGLEPTVANIGGELAADSFMTTNDCAKLESFMGSLDDIPSAEKTNFIASLNRNCYIGAVNFIITLILHYNPRARIVFISNYEYEDGIHTSYAPLIPAQESLAESWAFPLCEVWKKYGYSAHFIPGSKTWFNTKYPDVTAATTDVQVAKIYTPDGVHPHSDPSGNSNRVYAGILAEWLKSIR